jgi:hypothetical protein
MRRIVGLVVVLVSTLGVIQADPSSADKEAPTKVLALYNGRQIDLSVSWEGAQACAITDAGNVCFDTEAEMDEKSGAVRAAGAGAAPAFANCPTTLKLYANGGFGSPVISLGTRAVWIQLSTYGFSSITSSYVVGSCNAAFQDGSSITYPGATWAGASSGSMSAGWDNRVTKVYMA